MSNVTFLPGSFAFAFALILIRSKPSGITIEDFVLALRKSSSSDPNNSVSGSLLFDRAKLLQQLSCFSQQSSLHLHGTKSDQRVEASRDTEKVERNKKSVGRKRKLRSGMRTDSEMKNRLKRQRPSTSSKTVAEGHYRTGEQQHNVRTMVLQVIFQLNGMMREPPLKSADFINVISTACDTILQVINSAQDTRIADRSSRSQTPMLNEACQAAARVWSDIMSNLEADKVSSCARLDRVPLAVPMSSIVRSLLDQLHQHCLDEAKRRQHEIASTISRSAKLKEHSENTANKFDLFEYNTNALKRFLMHIMLTAAKLHTTHLEIFYAVANVFLQYVGESMGLYLFGDFGDDCSIEYVVPVPGMSKILSIGVSHAKSAARIEAPHLVEILRTIVPTLAPENLGCTATKVIENLQKTLMQGVFGDKNESVPFLPDSVARVDPEIVDTTDFALAYDEDGDDWFLTQVWELLGWDVLIG